VRSEQVEDNRNKGAAAPFFSRLLYHIQLGIYG
ncbi:hypothetical protein CCACVL1_30634, partial [Corchorus capsularis]